MIAGNLLAISDGQWGALAVIVAACVTAAGASTAAWVTTRRHASDAVSNHQVIIDKLESIDSRLGYVERDVATLTGRTDTLEDYLTKPGGDT